MVPIAVVVAVTAAATKTKRTKAAVAVAVAVVGIAFLKVVLAKQMLNFLVSSALVAITAIVGHQ